MDILNIYTFSISERKSWNGGSVRGVWRGGGSGCRQATLKTRRGGGGSETQARSPAASNMSSLASTSSFGLAVPANFQVFTEFWNLAPWLGNPGHRDLGLVREGHLQQPQQAHQHRSRPCLHLHMGWRHHIHYWWVPFDISSTMLIFSISYFLLDEKFGWVFFSSGFTGCVGALRENTTLLAAYAIFLAILLLLEVQLQHYLPSSTSHLSLS